MRRYAVSVPSLCMAVAVCLVWFLAYRAKGRRALLQDGRPARTRFPVLVASRRLQFDAQSGERFAAAHPAHLRVSVQDFPQNLYTLHPARVSDLSDGHPSRQSRCLGGLRPAGAPCGPPGAARCERQDVSLLWKKPAPT